MSNSVSVCVCLFGQMAAMLLSLALALERFWTHWKTPVVETTVDDFNRVKYQPQPSLT